MIDGDGLSQPHAVIRPGAPTIRTTFQFLGMIPWNGEGLPFNRARDVVLNWIQEKFPLSQSAPAMRGEDDTIDLSGQRLDCVSISEAGVWTCRLVQPDAPRGGCGRRTSRCASTITL
jgi:hypothetical protein